MNTLVFVINVRMNCNFSVFTQQCFKCNYCFTGHCRRIHFELNLNNTIRLCRSKCRGRRCTFNTVAGCLINKNTTHCISLTNRQILILNSIGQNNLRFSFGLMQLSLAINQSSTNLREMNCLIIVIQVIMFSNLDTLCVIKCLKYNNRLTGKRRRIKCKCHINRTIRFRRSKLHRRHYITANSLISCCICCITNS